MAPRMLIVVCTGRRLHRRWLRRPVSDRHARTTPLGYGLSAVGGQNRPTIGSCPAPKRSNPLQQGEMDNPAARRALGERPTANRCRTTSERAVFPLRRARSIRAPTKEKGLASLAGAAGEGLAVWEPPRTRTCSGSTVWFGWWSVAEADRRFSVDTQPLRQLRTKVRQGDRHGVSSGRSAAAYPCGAQSLHSRDPPHVHATSLRCATCQPCWSQVRVRLERDGDIGLWVLTLSHDERTNCSRDGGGWLCGGRGGSRCQHERCGARLRAGARPGRGSSRAGGYCGGWLRTSARQVRLWHLRGKSQGRGVRAFLRHPVLACTLLLSC